MLQWNAICYVFRGEDLIASFKLCFCASLSCLTGHSGLKCEYSTHNSLLFLLIFFQAAQKMQKEVVRLLVGLDSSLTKVKDKNGRIPADVVASNELEMLDMLRHEHK